MMTMSLKLSKMWLTLYTVMQNWNRKTWCRHFLECWHCQHHIALHYFVNSLCHVNL